MDNSVEQQRLNEYQNKVSDWIGRQGVLFQLRHARTVGSGSIAGNLVGLLVRFLILLVIAGVAGFFFLKSHFKSSEYQGKITNQIAEALGAAEIEPNEFSRTWSSGKFHELTMKGGEKSFFYDASFEEVSGAFSFLTGLTEDWQPSAIKMKKGELKFKAGGSVEEMEEGYSLLVESLSGNGLTQIKIDHFTFDWGYSKLTYGRVSNTSLKANLVNRRWEVTLTGGEFEQNWLGPMPLKKATLFVDENGLEVQSLSLALDRGKLDLTGGVSGPPNMPTFDLKGDFTSLPVEKLLVLEGVNTREYLEGTISGKLEIRGSSNRRMEMTGDVRLGEEDEVIIRERWELLRRLSSLDGPGTYLKINFSEGGFSFATSGGGMEVNNIDLRSGQNARLVGDLKTHLPSQEEAAEALGIPLTDSFSKSDTDTSAARKLENDRMSLDNLEKDDGNLMSLDDAVEAEGKRVRRQQLSEKQMESLRLKQEMEIHRVDSSLRLAIPGSAFDGNENLSVLYPTDEEGWRWIPIEEEGARFTTIGDRVKKILLDQVKARLPGN